MDYSTNQASLVVEVEEIDVYKQALTTALESKAGRKGALPASAGNGEPAPALPAPEKGACVRVSLSLSGAAVGIVKHLH